MSRPKLACQIKFYFSNSKITFEYENFDAWEKKVPGYPAEFAIFGCENPIFFSAKVCHLKTKK